MQLKTYNGYNNTLGVEVVGELSLEHFIVEETALMATSYNTHEWKIKLILKPELTQQLEVILSKHYRTKEVENVWVDLKVFHVNFQGCSSEESRIAKRDKVFNEGLEWIATNKIDAIYGLIASINTTLKNRASEKMRTYKTEMLRVLSGENLPSEFIEDYLDDEDIVEELEKVDTMIKELTARKNELHNERRIARNQNMEGYIDAHGWGDEEVNIQISQEVRDIATAMYRNGEAFKDNSLTVVHPLYNN